MKTIDQMIQDARAATPGPWGCRSTGEKCNDQIVAVFVDKDGNPVSGRIWDEDYLNDETNEDMPVDVDSICELHDSVFSPANATHIANASPEVFAALLEVFKTERDCRDYEDGDGRIDDDCWSMLNDDARKAHGRFNELIKGR